MVGLKFMICGFAIFLIVVILACVLIADLCENTWYDDAHEDEAEERYSLYVTKVEREMSANAKEHAKRESYNKCVNHSVIVNSIVSRYMSKINDYLTKYELKQFERFYTVYCKELANTLDSIDKCVSTSLYSNLVCKTRDTYGSIFSKMLADIETFIKNNSVSVTDIEGIKNFAKINGDFDENYKAEMVDNSVSDTSTILTSTTSAVENSAKNYANALTHAYEKVSQYKEENEQLTKELEKCRAEAKKHIDTTNSADKLKSDLAKIDKVISCQKRAGSNDSTLELMRTVRRQIAETDILYGKDNYTDYKLYCWGIPIEDYLNVWEAEFDYPHDYFYYE
nr:MAG TPA: hypothetical protein [Caudoviricetes sp.]